MQRLSDGGKVSQAFFKPGVYFVKTRDGRDAVLKIANNYNIEVHRKLSEEQLAPEIFGYEKLWNQFHVILMEYFDDFSYEPLFHFLQNPKKNVNCENLFGSLISILEKLENVGLFHGDFRSSNILAKESENDPSILEEFKLIDFDLSGRVGESYFMALKNCEITWPEN